MCILVEPTEQQLQRRKMSELQNTMNDIFGVPDDGASIVENIEKECKKKDKLEKRLNQPQVPLEGHNKRPKAKKPKKTVNLYNNLRDVLEDPPLCGDELQVPPPQPQVPSNLLMPGPSSAGFIEELPMPSLSSYEDMMKDDLFNGPSSVGTQPDTLQVLEEGIAVTQDGQTVELWQEKNWSTCWSIWKMKTNHCIPTLSFLTKDEPCAIPARSFLAVCRTSRLWRKPCVTRYTAKYSISGEPLAVVVD